MTRLVICAVGVALRVTPMEQGSSGSSVGAFNAVAALGV